MIPPDPDTRSPERRALDEQIAAEPHELIPQPSQDSDAKWEQLIASTIKSPKMEDFLRKSATEPAAPLDHDRK